MARNINKLDIDSLVDGEVLNSGAYTVRKSIASVNFDITFSDEVESPPFKYADLCLMLREEVKEDDVVNVYISNYGGCCDSAATIVNAMRDCKGTVNCIVTAPSYSAATMIALAGDTLVLKPYSYLMFHNFSAAESGKGGELKAAVINVERVIHGMMRSLYSEFLTKKEIADIITDKDVYVHWDDKDLNDRLSRKFKIEENQ